MSHSKFAMHSPSPDDSAIYEPVNKVRQSNGDVKAYYRSKAGKTWEQVFKVSHEAPLIEEPEAKEEQERPPAPEGNVLGWNDEQRSLFTKWYGLEEYKSLVAKAIKNEGYAEYQSPADEPDMPQVDDARLWTPKQRNNFIDKWGRDKYQERFSNAYKADREPVNG